ncbi:MAG: hypothetical protein AB7W59_05365 [Acidimicrobiia bacterium]
MADDGPEPETSPPTRRRSRTAVRTGAVIELVGHAAVAVALTWPLARHLDRIPLGTERVRTVPLFNQWTLAWTADRLPHRLQGWWDAPIFWPQRGAFALSEPQLPTGVAFAALRALSGDGTRAYNLTVLLLLTLNGLAMAALARALGAERAAAFGVGVLGQALPFSAHELGVLQLLAQAPMVATLAALIRWREAPALRPALAVGAGASLTALSCGYYGFALAIPVGLTPVLWLGRGAWRDRPPWRDALAGALVAGGIVAATALPVLLLQAGRTAGFSWSRDTVIALSAAPGDLAPAGPWWPGWLTVALAGPGLWVGRHRPAVRWLAAVAATGALAALGPRLSVLGWRPWWPLAEVVPGLDRLRNPSRFVVVLQLALVALAAPALQLLVQEVRRPGRVGAGRATDLGRVLVTTAIAAVAAVAVAAFPSDRRLAPGPPPPDGAARFLAATADREPVVVLPFAASGRVADFEATTVAMLHGLTHGHPLINGYSGFFPEGDRALRRTLPTFPAPDTLDALRARGVRWIVTPRAWLDAEGRAEGASGAGLSVAFDDGTSAVLELPRLDR